MQKLSETIFGLSPKKLAVYLVIGPLVYVLVDTIATVGIQNISKTTETSQVLTTSLLVVLFLFLAVLVALCLFWLRSVVYAVEKSDLGIPRRWFNIALIVFIAYLLYNACYVGIDYVPEEYRHVFNALSEFIAFGGVLMAFPTMCHYAARAVTAKRGQSPASFLGALPVTFLLVFGTVLGIPFLHKYFSTKTSTNSEILVIYAIAFGLCIVLFVVGFLAATTGLI